MAPPPEIALTVAYTARYNRLRQLAGARVGQLWERLAGLDDQAADRFATEASRVAVAAQAQAAAGVDGYLAAVVTLGSGQAYRPAGALDVTGRAVRAGADPLEVYHRGIITARAAIATGHAFPDAMRAGLLRSVVMAETDVSLTQRAAMDQAVDGQRIVGYRRVLTGSSCGRCASASTQRYHRAQLMPIHAHCDCGVSPIYGSSDPGQVINKKLVTDLKSAAKQTGDESYWTSRHIKVDADGTVRFPDVAVHEHGELGPTLADASHHFTGPDQLAA